MTGSDMSERPQSLARRVSNLETQIMLRHRGVRAVVAGCKSKINAWMVSPATLLEAFGIGVVLEQTSRHRDWSLATAVNAASAGIRLLLAFSSTPRSVNKNSTQRANRDDTRQ